jgi:hypothetical protein
VGERGVGRLKESGFHLLDAHQSEGSRGLLTRMAVKITARAFAELWLMELIPA